MISLTNQTLNDIKEYNERLAQLMPDIQAIAVRYAGSGTGAVADELEADMIYSILERQDKDPEFLSDKNNDSYILHFARFIPWGYIQKKQRRFDVEVDGMNDAQYAKLDAEMSQVLSKADDITRAEWALDIVDAVSLLSKRETQVVALVVKGFETPEIAKKLGVTQPAICSYRNRAIKKMRAAVL